MKIFLPFVLSIFMLNVLGCHKTDVINPNIPTKTELATSSAWTYADGGVDANRDGVVDAGGSFSALLPTLVPSCRTDNQLSFKKDNTGIVDEGTTKCNTTDAQTTTFNWSFADNEANLQISNNVFALLNGKSKIYALTATQFSLTRDTVLGGTTYPILVILKH
ncbi:hypothetical protein [Flavisolibacter ginsenosidimutans]|uniref:Lipocalin-like domain-containing protein n=1 Tax=Flavisolibacter ginsenosidimutans TaxID=661481 RepID=A0A5B8UL19_9BACT|nr:hypothetical protein [Flavisolibacter ginsenosidimutans]QEC57384.1 hypothetical protein FSB75_16245 [Flavisolibacter ginsenosidimutans]